MPTQHKFITAIPLPSESQHFKARYKTSLGIAILAFGLLVTLIIVWSMLLSGEFSVRIIVGILPVIIGVLYLTRPYFVVAPNRLTVYSPIGQVMKRYPFRSFDDVQVINGRLYVESNDPTKTGAEKVKVSRRLTHEKDWKTLKGFTNSEA